MLADDDTAGIHVRTFKVFFRREPAVVNVP